MLSSSWRQRGRVLTAWHRLSYKFFNVLHRIHTALRACNVYNIILSVWDGICPSEVLDAALALLGALAGPSNAPRSTTQTL